MKVPSWTAVGNKGTWARASGYMSYSPGSRAAGSMGLASFTATLSHKTIRVAGTEPHTTSDLSIFQWSQWAFEGPSNHMSSAVTGKGLIHNEHMWTQQGHRQGLGLWCTEVLHSPVPLSTNYSLCHIWLRGLWESVLLQGSGHHDIVLFLKDTGFWIMSQLL